MQHVKYRTLVCYRILDTELANYALRLVLISQYFYVRWNRYVHWLCLRNRWLLIFRLGCPVHQEEHVERLSSTQWARGSARGAVNKLWIHSLNIIWIGLIDFEMLKIDDIQGWKYESWCGDPHTTGAPRVAVFKELGTWDTIPSTCQLPCRLLWIAPQVLGTVYDTRTYCFTKQSFWQRKGRLVSPMLNAFSK